MTPEERETILTYVSEVESFARLYARQFKELKALLVEQGRMTPEQLNEAMRKCEGVGAVEEALDPRFQALERLRRWLEGQE